MLCRPFGVLAALLAVVGVAVAQPVGPYAEPGYMPAAGEYPPLMPPSPQYGSLDSSPWFGSIDVAPFLKPGGPTGYRWWLTGEYLLGWTRESNLEQSLASVGPPDTLGILGSGGTSVLGNRTVDFGTYQGGRFSSGLYLDATRVFSLELSVFFLSERTQTSSVTAAPGQALGRPFFDLATLTENVRQITIPGQFNGSVSSKLSSFVWGMDVGAGVKVYESDTWSLDQLFAFRHVGFEEKLDVNDSSTAQGAGVVFYRGQAFGEGNTVAVNDHISSINRFYGGNVGVRVNWTPGRFTSSIYGRFGAGTMQQNTVVDGTTILTGPGGQQVSGGGLLSLGRNLGSKIRYELSFAPEVGANLNYRLTDHLSLTAGYNLLYLTNVSRPSLLATREINSAKIPSGANFGAPFVANEPNPRFGSTDLWIQTVTFGAFLNY